MEAFAVAQPGSMQASTASLRGYASQNMGLPVVPGPSGAAMGGAAWSASGVATLATVAGLFGGLLRSSKRGARARKSARRGVAREAGSGRECRYFLDTADETMWERYLPQGWLWGVTMNPAILERSNLPVNIESFKYCFDKLQKYGLQEHFFQATGTDVETLVKGGKAINAMDPDKTVVKLPLTEEGLRAGKQLKDETGTKMCTTICYSANHGFLSNGLGAEYIAPYLGRMEALSHGGMERCRELHNIVGGKEGHTRVQVAAIRNAGQMVTLSQSGLDTYTFGPAVAEELVTNANTIQSLNDFEAATERASAFKVPQ